VSGKVMKLMVLLHCRQPCRWNRLSVKTKFH